MMKTDWVTKLLLAGILFFLAVLALKPSAPAVAPAFAQSKSSGAVAAAAIGNSQALVATENKWAIIDIAGDVGHKGKW